jgi:hypothetical protein
MIRIIVVNHPPTPTHHPDTAGMHIRQDHSSADSPSRAFADDIDIIAHSAAKAQQLFDIVKNFLSITGLELNEKKTVYIRNETAHNNNSAASLILNGRALKEEPKKATFCVLGVLFSMEGDWKAHKKTARGCCIQRLKQLAKKRITDIQYVEVVNIIILAALSYGMTVVDYNQVELNELNGVIHSYVRKRMRVSPADTKGWEAVNAQQRQRRESITQHQGPT